MQPGYPLGPRLNLFDRQRISTQSHQRQTTLIVTPDAVAVLGLFGQSVVTLDVRDRGVLVIDFEGGAGLWVGSDPQFESWHLNGHGVDPIVVGPGGEENWER
ncbi:DUF6188 family protein [Streptomyces sp. NPDC052207]|uniref:DUF6188 family protein n=1 Tax=Streptomyces sp. NPDC052207 TaxID=3155418 RepID=UPI00341EC260